MRALVLGAAAALVLGAGVARAGPPPVSDVVQKFAELGRVECDGKATHWSRGFPSLGTSGMRDVYWGIYAKCMANVATGLTLIEDVGLDALRRCVPKYEPSEDISVPSIVIRVGNCAKFGKE
jgi:hypothetical protein